jgi:hypothetical protein
MSLVLNGSGTITGLSAGGLPDGSVTADDIASTLDLSGKTVTLPSGTGGKVLQVVQGTALSALETTTTSGSWVATTATASITPSSTSNSILVLSTVHAGATNASVYTAAIFALQRDIGGGGYSEIYAPTTTDGGGNVYGGAWVGNYGGANEFYGGAVDLNYVDSPSSTSSVTYRIAFRGLGGYGTARIDKGSRLILMEIAA